MPNHRMTSRKLTKRRFMELPEFTFIASGVCGSNRVPLFSAHVSAARRNDQWGRIVRAGVSQRNFLTFVNKQQYLNHFTALGVSNNALLDGGEEQTQKPNSPGGVTSTSQGMNTRKEPK